MEVPFSSNDSKDINTMVFFRRNFNKIIPGRSVDPESRLLQEFQRKSAEMEQSVFGIAQPKGRHRVEGIY
jgi:hypothetical protein